MFWTDTLLVLFPSRALQLPCGDALLAVVQSVFTVPTSRATQNIPAELGSVPASATLGPIQRLRLLVVASCAKVARTRRQVGQNAALLDNTTKLICYLASYATLESTLLILPNRLAQVVKAARARSQARRCAAALARTWLTPPMRPAQNVKEARARSQARRCAAALERTWLTPPMCPAQDVKPVKFQVLAPQHAYLALTCPLALDCRRLALGEVS